MNARLSSKCLLIALVGKFALTTIGSEAEPPAFLKVAFIGSNAALVFSSKTTNWIALEASQDLVQWTEIASVATTNDATFFIEAGAALWPRRFYRLRLPDNSLEVAAKKWNTRTTPNYQLQLSRVNIGKTPTVLKATITVARGQKTISDATADGRQLSQPDPNDFPSIEELFAQLANAQATGCRQVWFTYEATQEYLVECVIDQRVAAASRQGSGQAVRFLVSEVRLIAD